jgi:hypothetical protein
MRINRIFFNAASVSAILIVLVLAVSQCAVKQPATELPRDILGISVGMNRAAAEPRLKEIGKLIRLEKKRQEIWTLKSDPRFGHLVVGYDKEDKIRYVSAFAKPKDGTPVKPSEIGNLSEARHESVQASYSYIWQAPARDGKPPYVVTVLGNQPEILSQLSLSNVIDENAPKEEEEEEK